MRVHSQNVLSNIPNLSPQPRFSTLSAGTKTKLREYPETRIVSTTARTELNDSCRKDISRTSWSSRRKISYARQNTHERLRWRPRVSPVKAIGRGRRKHKVSQESRRQVRSVCRHVRPNNMKWKWSGAVQRPPPLCYKRIPRTHQKQSA